MKGVRVFVFNGARAFEECPPGLAPASELGETITITKSYNGVTYHEALVDRTTNKIVGVAQRSRD